MSVIGPIGVIAPLNCVIFEQLVRSAPWGGVNYTLIPGYLACVKSATGQDVRS